MEMMAATTTADARVHLLRAILDSQVDPCVVLEPVRDAQGEIIDFTWIDANRAACVYNGLAFDEFVGRRLCESLPSHRSTGLFDEYRRVVETRGELRHLDLEYTLDAARGDPRRFDLHAREVDGHLVVSWRDCTERHDQVAAMAESERRFRILAEAASDVVYEVDRDGTILWVSPSVERVLGWKPEDWLGRPSSEMVAPEDLQRMTEHSDAVATGAEPARIECRYLTVNGDRRWTSAYGHVIFDDQHEITGGVIGLSDIQNEVVARRAALTLSAGNAVLVRAQHEGQLLFEMCETAIAKGGYLFAWYGRPAGDERKSVRPAAWSQAHRDYLDSVEISWGDGPLGQGPTGTCIRTGKPRVVADFLTDLSYQPWVDTASKRGFRSSASLPVFVDGALDGAWMVYAAEANAFDHPSVTVLLDLTAQLGYGLSRLRDQQRLALALDEQRLLGTAIDQAAEAVVVTDTTPAIRYANPAALRLTGYSADEVIGKNPSIFKSGLHDHAFYEQMWSTLLGGKSWHGVLMNRKKNGDVFEEDTSITPVHDASGERIAFVAVKHDLSRERTLEAAVTRDQLDRDAVIEVMREVRYDDTLEGTATAFCHAIRRFEYIDGAMVIVLQPDGSAVPIASVGPLPRGQEIGSPLAVAKIDLLVAMSEAGPWWMDYSDGGGFASIDPGFTASMRELGFTASGYAPIRYDDENIGVLAVATKSADPERWMQMRLGVLAEVGSFAGMLIGPQAREHGRVGVLREQILDIIEHRRFHTVFEPVVDLGTGNAVGFEALTRFDDDVPPDQRFADAQLVGLGGELEATCAAAALDHTGGLLPGAWVAVNFSPSTVVEGRAAAVVANSPRPVVIEITEHNAIENYAAVRRAIAKCGDVRVAVDDAGAGFASLRHILELQPDIIKLDLALVRDIDTDPARQALAAGLRHFAALTGTTLIAEGVETPAEARTIRELGVNLVQGFLFGDHRA